MKIETTPREDHQVEIVAEFEPEFMEKYKRQAARKISKESRIPGFRPGKAPYDVVRRIYGDEAIQKEALELLLDQVYPEVLKEAGIEPGGPGSLQEVLQQDPPKLSLLVPLQPTVELGDYQTIQKEFLAPIVGDEKIDQTLKNLRSNYSTAEPVDRPTQESDLVSVKVGGTFVEPVEGESSEAIKENSVQMIVGENEFETDDWPYEGFSRELVGMSAGDEKEITYTYPQDYDDDKLKGREVRFKIQVISVKSLIIPEMNDEFVHTLGDYESVDALRDIIRKNLQESEGREYESSYFTQLIDEVIERSVIKFPPQVLQQEIEQVMHSLEHDLTDRKLDMPTYLKTLNKDEKTFIEEDIKPVAKRRLERSLVMDEIARAEKIRLNPQDLQQEVMATMQMYQQSDPQFGKLKGAQAENFAQGLTMEAASRMLNRAVMNRLKAIANNEEIVDAETLSEEPPAPAMEQTEELTSSAADQPIEGQPAPAAADSTEEQPQAEEPKDEKSDPA